MNRLALFFLFAVGCIHRAPDSSVVPIDIDVVIVPGCPAEADGTLSSCQWERIVWAAQLYEDGVTDRFITSGGAVYNRYIEAEAMAAGLVALGVPAGQVYTETQALHSDENLGYGLALADSLGHDDVGFTTHDAHATVIRQMLHAWGVEATIELPMDEQRVAARIAAGLPDVSVAPVPESEWLPLKQREKVVSARLGEPRRLPSWVLYGVGAVIGPLMPGSPPEPPVSEPTLQGLRHRVDTRPWDSDGLVSVGD